MERVVQDPFGLVQLSASAQPGVPCEETTVQPNARLTRIVDPTSGLRLVDASMEVQSGWRVIGTVTVDSGGLLLVDPTYRTGGFYGGAEEDSALECASRSGDQAAALRTVAGIVVGTMIAGVSCAEDECLVEGRYVTDGRGGVRLAEVRIRF